MGLHSLVQSLQAAFEFPTLADGGPIAAHKDCPNAARFADWLGQLAAWPTQNLALAPSGLAAGYTYNLIPEAAQYLHAGRFEDAAQKTRLKLVHQKSLAGSWKNKTPFSPRGADALKLGPPAKSGRIRKAEAQRHKMLRQVAAASEGKARPDRLEPADIERALDKLP